MGKYCFRQMFEAEGGAMNTAFAGENVNGVWTLDIFDDVEIVLRAAARAFTPGATGSGI